MQRRNPLDRPISAAVSARMERLFPSRACLPLAMAGLLGLGAVSAPQAATIVVSSTADPGDASTCTLRQAIVSVTTGSATASCMNTGGAFGDNDTINFANSLFSGSTATITTTDSLNVESYRHIQLTIDAGNARNVVVERSASVPNPFSVFVDGNNADLYDQLTLIGLTIQNGYAKNSLGLIGKYCGTDASCQKSIGGGIATRNVDLTLERCIVRNNRAQYGGGIGHVGRPLTLVDTTVSGNYAIEGGGGVYADSAIIKNSTISGNVALAGGGMLSYLVPPQIVNSTISGNSAPIAPAIFIYGLATPFSLTNSTVACNSAAAGVAQAAIEIKLNKLPSAGVTAVSTIFADTSNSACSASNVSSEIELKSGTLAIVGDHNLVASGSIVFPADTIFGDPLLGPLSQNNGGPTPTHALLAGSPAIDKGSNPSNQPYDQRGSPYGRWVGSNPDIGAFESQYSYLCGTADGHSFVTLSSSTANLCGSGAYLQGSSVSGSGPWSWFCAANADHSKNEFCSAQVQANASLTIDNASGAPINSAVFGQPLLLKAVVGGGSSTPTGTVTFADVTGSGFSPLCVNVTLSGGETACDTTNTPIDAGVRQLEVVYNGDGDVKFGVATSSPGGITINPAQSTTSVLGQTPNPVSAGKPFTVVAQVAVNAPSVATPNGIVEIDDTTDGLSCTYALAAPTPGCELTPTSLGTHSLLVHYLGDANINASSVVGQETVNDVIFRDGFE